MELNNEIVKMWESDGRTIYGCPFCGNEEIEYGDIFPEVGIADGGHVIDTFSCGKCGNEWYVDAYVVVESRKLSAGAAI